MQKVQVQLIDDTDGSDAAETVDFGLDGTAYAIDLSLSNAAELRASIAEYVEHARKASPLRERRTRRNRTDDAAVTRQWLIDHGHTEGLSDRGRIPAHLQAIYDNRGQAPEPEMTRLSPEREAAIAAQIADAKDEVKQRRQERAARTSKPATATAPAAAEPTATATASPTAATTTLKRPAQRSQRRKATDANAAETGGGAVT